MRSSRSRTATRRHIAPARSASSTRPAVQALSTSTWMLASATSVGTSGPLRGRNCGKNEVANTAAFGLAAIDTSEARNAAPGGGTILSPERRRSIAAWARERDALIIENDYAAEFRYDGPPIGAVQGLAPDHMVYLGTTSKTLAPAVRLGSIAAPAEVTSALADAQTGTRSRWPAAASGAVRTGRLHESRDHRTPSAP